MDSKKDVWDDIDGINTFTLIQDQMNKITQVTFWKQYASYTKITYNFIYTRFSFWNSQNIFFQLKP